MKISQKAIDLLKFSEGSKSNKYIDINGNPTIGIGHKITRDELSTGTILINEISVKYTEGLTDEQIRDLCMQDLKIASDCVNRTVKVVLNQNQFDCLVEFTFNVGIGAFSSSTLLKILNKKDFVGVPEQLKRWVHDGEKNVIKGLVTRRENEIKLWNK